MYLILFLTSCSVGTGQHSYKVGLLVSLQNTHLPVLEVLAPYTIHHFNNNTSSSSVNLTLSMATYTESSLQGILRATCELVNSGAVTVITPDGSNAVASAAQILTSLQVPLIAVVATDPFIRRYNRRNMLLFAPSDKYQSRVILDFLNLNKWREVAIIASDSNYGLNGGNYFHQMLTDDRDFNVKVITFFDGTTGFESVNRSMVHVWRSLARVVLLHCEGRFADRVLSLAYDMGLLGGGYVWIVTDDVTGSPHVLASNAQNYIGLIGIRFAVDKQTNEFQKFRDEFSKLPGIPTGTQLNPALTMTHDAILLTGNALADRNESLSSDAKCNFDEWASWSDGERFYEHLRQQKYQGAAGLWAFNDTGLVAEAKYEIVNFRAEGYEEPKFHEIGRWNSRRGLEKYSGEMIRYLGGKQERPVGIANNLNGRHLKLGMTSNPPFASKKINCSIANCWEGICPDIVQSISERLNFSFEYVEPEDGEFGWYDSENDKWNGLIGDMISGKTDMISMDISIGAQRKKYIDFTVSFMDSGISLAVKGESGKNSFYFFLSPFSDQIWAMIVSGVLIMGICLNLLSKLSPFGSYGKKAHARQTCKCNNCTKKRIAKKQLNIKFEGQLHSDCHVTRTEEKDDNPMTFYNSLWIAGAGLMGKPGGVTPSSPSGRCILLSWWFFMLLILSMYTANLTAFMTLDKIGITVSSAKELLAQNKRKYEWGIIKGSFVESLFKNNIDPDYKKLVERAVKLKSDEEGKMRVKEGRFVFIDETPLLQYHLLDGCTIFPIGLEIQPFDYAFGLPKNSPYTELMNAELINMRETGYFDELWKKWDKTPGAECKNNLDGGGDAVLGMSALKGIIFVLVLGLGISFMILWVEIVVATMLDEADEDHMTFCSKLHRRLRLKLEDIRTEWFRSSTKHITYDELEETVGNSLY